MSACAKQEESEPPKPLSEFELLHGIGPVKEPLQYNNLDSALTEAGRKAYMTKCTSCHRMDERFVGPPLRTITDRRSGAFIMNQILNPAEMAKRHPEIISLKKQYGSQMTFQNSDLQEARAILEYLRAQARETE